MEKKIEILLVEDNEDDIDLTKIALKRGKINNNLFVVNDGMEAMDFLNKKNGFENHPTPDIILLDLNLPGKDGREVLQEVKNDKNLKRIPVVILTTSTADEDILSAYDSYANCYLAKPLDFDRFKELVSKIEDFWFSIVRLPNKE